MKWLARTCVALAAAVIFYCAFAVYSIGTLVDAVRRDDGEAVFARTDISRIRHAMVDQIMSAYFGKQAEKRSLTLLQRMALNAYGSTVADEFIRKLLTPENMRALLRYGSVKNDSSSVTIDGLPPLSDIHTDNVFALLGRITPVKPVEFFVRLGDSEDDAGVSLHFDNFTWRISGVRLPKRLVEKIIARLPSS
jgi:hypothetical protein